jgi:sterol carrier protein 2
MGNKVYVVGVGMTKFEKPGSRDWDYPDMAKEAGSKALADAGIDYDAIEQACVGYCYGDSTCGERAVYTLGLTGIPVYNVNNNCATGSTALFMAKQFVEGGLNDCVLALGFEKMEKGSLGIKYTDRTNPMDKHAKAMIDKRGFAKAPPAPQFFGNAGREHMERYGTTNEHFAKIGWKNHKHSVNNPYSQFQDEYSLEDIKNAPMVYEPLTKLQCCPTSDGAGAAVLASEAFVRKHGLESQAVEIIGMAMTSDFESTFSEDSSIKLVGSDMTRRAAEKVYELLLQRAHHLRGAWALPRGQGRRVHRLRRPDLRRPGGGESVGRPDLEGAPARRHRACPVLGAQLAAPGRGGEAPGGGRASRPAAQPGPRRRRRGDGLPQGGSRLKAAP